MNKERDFRFDLMRIIAMFMVVLMHSPIPGSAPGVVLSGISYLTEPGVGLFFMISGALLLDNKFSTREFLTRRFTKVLYPTLFWSLFYLVFRVIETPLTLSETIRAILSIPFSTQGRGVFWFMYTLAGLYLLTPILSQWIKSASKNEVKFFLFLWLITLLYPLLGIALEINESNTGVLYYFSGYAGYFLLGFYLKRYYSFRKYHIVIAILVSALIPIVLYSSQLKFDYYTMFWYLTLPIASMSFCWFVMINRMRNRCSLVIREVARLSFGVYLVHIFIMRNVLWKIGLIGDISWFVQIPLITILTFVLSVLISWLISRLPFSKYIIGV